MPNKEGEIQQKKSVVKTALLLKLFCAVYSASGERKAFHKTAPIIAPTIGAAQKTNANIWKRSREHSAAYSPKTNKNVPKASALNFFTLNPPKMAIHNARLCILSCSTVLFYPEVHYCLTI